MTVVSDLASDYSPSGFFVIRTPLLPFSDLVAWGSGLTAPELDMTGEALADDREDCGSVFASTRATGCPRGYPAGVAGAR